MSMNLARPLRVLLMSGSMDVGGSEQQTCLLLKHLDRNQFDPRLYLTYRRGELLSRVPEDVAIEAFDDLPLVTRINWPGRWHYRMVNHLRGVIESNEIDVVYDRTFHMSLIAADACGGRVGRVSTIVCPPSQDLPSSEGRFLELKRRKLARAYRKSSQVIAVSDVVAESASEYYGLARSKILTLRSPVDTDGLRAAARSLPAEMRELRPSPAINVICIGRMTQEKGQDTLLAAIRIFSELRSRATEFETAAELGAAGAISAGQREEPWAFWFVGDGPLRDRWEREAGSQEDVLRNSKSSIQIRFTGRLPSVAALLSHCQLLVCPSRYEGLPNVVLEAMALGVPVIGSRIGGIAEVVEHDRTGRLFAADDPTALASELVNFSQNRARMREMAENATAAIDHGFKLAPYIDQIGGCLRAAAKVV